MTKYRTSISYQTSGERVQITGTRPNGQSCSNVEVLSGAYAWNEDTPGAELIADKGKATPMPATVEERMIRLWAGPQGAWKAAITGTSDVPQMTARPQRVPADVMTAGKTSVVWENNKPVLTFPIPGLATAQRTAGKTAMRGNWGGAPQPIAGSGTRRCGPTQALSARTNPEVGCKTRQDHFWVDYEWLPPSRFGVWGLPTYKPEF